MSKEISSSDEIIDSRDVIRRRNDLQEELDDLQLAVEEARDLAVAADGAAMVEVADNALEDVEANLKSWLEDNEEELKALQALCDEGEGYCPDWRYGTALIRDSYFQQHAVELAEDIGAINREGRWPNHCIDWEQAAKELKMDYTSLEFEGVTYWAR